MDKYPTQTPLENNNQLPSLEVEYPDEPPSNEVPSELPDLSDTSFLDNHPEGEKKDDLLDEEQRRLVCKAFEGIRQAVKESRLDGRLDDARATINSIEEVRDMTTRVGELMRQITAGETAVDRARLAQLTEEFAGSAGLISNWAETGEAARREAVLLEDDFAERVRPVRSELTDEAAVELSSDMQTVVERYEDMTGNLSKWAFAAQDSEDHLRQIIGSLQEMAYNQYGHQESAERVKSLCMALEESLAQTKSGIGASNTGLNDLKRRLDQLMKK